MARPTVDAPELDTTKRRRWPALLLALATIGLSGLVAWAVASNVSDDQPTAVSVDATSATSSDTSAAPQTAELQEESVPPVVDTALSAEIFENEPFAVAAAKIRPSVVQLNLGTGLGTGVIIDADGTILTAAHVVGNATDVRVTFFDGSSVDGEVVGTHAPTDVAVVRVNPGGRTLVPAPLADGENVRVGQFAVAVGSPFGFDQTVTAGIISAVDRVVNTVSMVQTDAPINPGNSGGPLINLQGEVVGINDLIFTEDGDSSGVGFAISIDLAMIVAEQLIAGDDVQLAFLGVRTMQPANGSAGAQIETVEPNSAAESSGLQPGDIVTAVNGDSTRGSAELRAQVIDNPPGTVLVLDVVRDGAPITIEVTLGETS